MKSKSKFPEKSQRVINPSRLTLARFRNHLSKKELADRLEKSPRTISAWEAGDFGNTEVSLNQLTEVLGFPKEYFLGDDLDLLDAEAVSFRGIARMTARRRNAVLASGTFGVQLSEWLDAQFHLPAVDLPCFSSDKPENAAILLRQHWKLGEKPISNIIHLLESKGVRVFSLAEDCTDVDAFSFWRDDVPYVFLNLQKSSERSRFDAAHELAHLILHRGGTPKGLSIEREADSFASAFLLPPSYFLSLPRGALSIQHLLKVKKKWKVSLFATVVRLHRLDRLSDWTYRSMCMEIRKRFGNQEPDSIDRERSQVLDKMLKSLWSDGVTTEAISEETTIPVHEILALTFGLTSSENTKKGIERHSLSVVR